MRSQIVTSSGESLGSQFAILNQNKRNKKVTPYAFTEQGVAMIIFIFNP